MEFSRSLSSPDLNCRLDSDREQINQVTHWLDGSQIYGSSVEESALLRGPDGLLKASGPISGSASGQTDSLPTCGARSDGIDSCDSCQKVAEAGSQQCFFAGDSRVNEQPNLIVMHTVFLREHNRLVGILSELNPHWDGERLYEEARRINVAQYQHIVYKEWLPIVLGNQAMREYGLLPLVDGHSIDYDDKFDPRIFNEFATAAFRFGHSLIMPSFVAKPRHNTSKPTQQPTTKQQQPTTTQQPPTTQQPTTTQQLITTQQSTTTLEPTTEQPTTTTPEPTTIPSPVSGKKLRLRDVFFRPDLFNSSELFASYVRGLVDVPTHAWDSNFVPEIRDHLFETALNTNGMDLIALNIQRGRDHGLPGYIHHLRDCTGQQVKSWTDLELVMRPLYAEKMRKVYVDLDDIDLFVGGFLETAVNDSLIGPTFNCIIARQFARLKKGDRFYYDLGIEPHVRFSRAQLAQVRRVSLARVLCDNSDVGEIQPFPLQLPLGQVNAVQPCENIDKMKTNWTAFKER